jgi:ABC-type proline/glycine betaine transport system permease subunit
MAGLGVFVLALMFTTTMLHETWFPTSLASRLVIGARSIAVASPIIAVGASFMGGGATGIFIWQGKSRPDYLALSMVVLLALVFDEVLGLVQMALTQSGPILPQARST